MAVIVDTDPIREPGWPDDATLLARIPEAARPAHGIPSADQLERGDRAFTIAQRVLDGYARPDGFRVSPLGAGWSRDIDVHVARRPADGALRTAGWLPMGELAARLGSSGDGQWVVVDDDGEVLASVDLHETPPPAPVGAVLDRCMRRRSVRAREVLELRALLAAGEELPADHPALAAAAAIEAWLGGDALAAHRRGPAAAGPIELPRPRWRRVARAMRTPVRRRLVLALSGVDGAGKSTLSRLLREDLERAGVPVSAVWARPGMNLGGLTKLSRPLKRALRQPSTPGVRMAASGAGGQLRSRRGWIGWIWSSVVTVAFVVDVWRQQLAARGVVLHDRHRVDACATLDVLYGGPDLRVQKSIIRRLLPKAYLTAYLDIDAETAAARKPGDTIGAFAVAAQLDRYRDELDDLPRLLVLDATAPAERNAREVLWVLLGVRGGPDAGRVGQPPSS